jgi:prepilin-type N-terminal cleavage/methylation domain-containing protein
MKIFRRNAQKGFTLIEMLVVIGVIVVVAGVMLANNTRFGGAVLLENFAYDVALQVRQAQVYGVSVVRFGNGNYSAPYGVHFDRSSNTSYLFFADATTNGVYDPGELVKTTTMTRGFKIGALCATPASGNPPVEDCTMTNVDITYKRPEPDAYIAASGGVAAPPYTSARVQLISPRNDTMSVIIYNNGQISVQRP